MDNFSPGGATYKKRLCIIGFGGMGNGFHYHQTVDHDHYFKDGKRNEFVTVPVPIGKNVWICANCTILTKA